jgi:hypothetical protein
MKYHIYHHDDMDGHSSGGLTGAFLMKNNVLMEDIKYYRMSYGDNFDDSQINYDEDIVFFVDFSLQPYTRMTELGDKLPTGNLFWIDHHITTRRFLDENPDFNWQGIVHEGTKAACALVWEWFENTTPIHAGIELISQYDTWNKEGEYDWDNEVLPYQLYLASIETNPCNTNFWSKFVYPSEEDTIPKEIKEGKAIQGFNNRRQGKLVKDNAYEIDFCGYKAIVMNTPERGSIQFGPMVENYDLALVYCNQGPHWTVSLYSEKPEVDCGALAKQIGEDSPLKSGGGHKGAGGFQTSTEHLFSLLK